jgi:RNA-directed DNA polymerase
MKQSLTIYIENAQKTLAETTLKYDMNSKKVHYLMECYLHTILFHVYSIEILSRNSGSKTPGSDNLVLLNNPDSKLFLLGKLKSFYSIEKIPGKRIYIPNTNSKEVIALTIPSIIDRAIQQLFLLILDPVIETQSDLFSFGFRKGHNQIMAIAHIQKKLQHKPSHLNVSSKIYPII